MNRLCFVFAICLCVSACDQSSSSNSNSQGEHTSSATAQPASDQSTQSNPGAKWIYSEDTDKMRSTTAKYARLESENELSFGFPYKGGKTTLVLRKRPEDGMSIMLQVEGQFLCNSYSGDTVSVKFDSRPIEKFSCSEPQAGTTGVLFINGEKRFIGSLRKAKAMIVEAQFYSYGRRQMEFDVAGLDWK